MPHPIPLAPLWSRLYITIALLLACGLPQAAAPTADTPTTRPNILILFADDLRSSVIHPTDKPVKTPHLDMLAAKGMAFPHAYIMGGQGGAVCLASRAMLMTGRHLHHLRRNGQDIATTETMLGETLAAAGYHTYGIGKWHNGVDTYMRNFRGGDEILFGGMTQDQFNIPLCHYNKDGQYSNQCKVAITDRKDLTMLCDHIYKDRHSSEIFADAAISFLESEKARDPFFLYVSFTAPHDPRQAPQEYLDMYPLDKVELPPNFWFFHPFNNGHQGRDENLLPKPRDPEKVRAEIRDYYAIISHLDAQVGRIMDSLDKSGQADNTIIIFSGDNGLSVGQHGLLGKQSLYEHSINVPLIWAGPGIPAGKTSAAYCYLTEIYPTLCDMLKLDKPASIDTDSYLACLRDETKPFHKEMYFGFRQLHRAASDLRYKLIEYNVEGNRHTQLFDLQADPWENNNLADKPDMAETKAALRKKLQDYHRSHGDNGEFWSGF